MDKTCDTCRHKGIKLGNGNQPCDNCVQHTYTNWKPKEERIAQTEKITGDDILKIYQFPEGYAAEFVVICKGRRFYSWYYNDIAVLTSPADIEKIFSYNLDVPDLISSWQHKNWGQLAQECLDGKHEQYCVWRREEGMKDNQPEPFWIVWNPTIKTNPPMDKFFNLEAAEKEALRLAEGSSWNDKWYVARVESHFQRQEVVKTEYKKD